MSIKTQVLDFIADLLITIRARSKQRVESAEFRVFRAHHSTARSFYGIIRSLKGDIFVDNATKRVKNCLSGLKRKIFTRIYDRLAVLLTSFCVPAFETPKMTLRSA